MKNDSYTRESDKRFTLRIDADTFKQVSDLAGKHKRSVGREIEFILEEYLQNNAPKESK